MEIAIEQVSYRLRTPLRTAYGEVHDRTTLVLSITGVDGVTGRGEAAPLEPFDGVPLTMVEEALQRYAEVLRRAEGRTGAEVLDACRGVADLPQALAAVDLALWDAAGQRARRPIAALLSDEPLSDVPVNATIGAVDPPVAAAEAAAVAQAGFACVKVKVGHGDDFARIEAVRAAVGDGMRIRLDANGAWTVDEAVTAITALTPLGLELVEEPVTGIDALREVRDRVPVRIAMDETVAELGAVGSGAADAFCLKISRAGGISALLAQAAVVRATGGEVYVSSTLDGPLGVAAAVHCAAALRVELPCGLATLDLLEHDPHPEEEAPPLAVRGGEIRVPDRPGLGV